MSTVERHPGHRMKVPADLKGPQGVEAQPVSEVRWVPRELVQANAYNPNKVAPPELRLLRVSLLADGWTQPLVCREIHRVAKTKKNEPSFAEVDHYEIVDGFHRWLVSEDKRIAAMTGGLVPVTVLVPASHEFQMMSTIRHNRARGNHEVLKMADIAAEMVAAGVPDDRIMDLLQMEDEELERLKARGDMRARGSADGFGKGWKPK